jgi:3-deoxy-manno-octulosonate cytidylyltransferase (CMP-KDO synthetase)
MSSIGIIPARYASTRFPGKPLAMIGDKSMIQRVYENASLATLVKVVVATDNELIKNHVTDFGGEVIMTSPDHQTGTERCLEALEKSGDNYDIVLNIQGDEPFIEPDLLNELVSAFSDKNVQIATPIKKISSHADLFSPHLVKVVKNTAGFAAYFSRSPIPFMRQYSSDQWLKHHQYYSHIGIYAFRSSVLKEIVQLPPNENEIAESLEQLRWLMNGYQIKVIETEYHNISIDTPEDLEKTKAFLNNFIG